MKNIKTIILIAMSALSLVSALPAAADSDRHTRMDLEAAKRDVRMLEADRQMARRNHEWKKVEQDDRLISQDMYWIHKYEQKLWHDRHHRG